jgi:hypothetical protein
MWSSVLRSPRSTTVGGLEQKVDSSTMRMRFPDVAFVEATEETARCATQTAFSDRDWRFRFVIDELLKLPHFDGECEPVSTPMGSFQGYARVQCAQSAYTLLAAYRLWRAAFYSEAIVLLRHLLEVFIQLRYFRKYPERVNAHVTAKLPKDRVPFRAMFDEFALGSYEKVYRLLSNFSHGNATLLVRTRTKTSDDPMGLEFVKGCEFDLYLAKFVYLFLVCIALAFFDHHSSFFPKNSLAEDKEFAEDVADTRAWLREVLLERREALDDAPAAFTLLLKLIAV